MSALLSEAKNAIYFHRKYSDVPIKMANFRVLYIARTKQINRQYLRENGCLGDRPAKVSKH